LAGGVAHDFNNLLGVILNYRTLIARRVTDEQVLADLLEIRAAAERAAALTRQLLTFARRDSATPEPLDLNAVVRGVGSMLVRTIGEQVDLRLELDDSKPLVVVADRHLLEQVVLNLAFNSRDAMPTGGVLTIATSLSPSGINLRVTDTGSGMDADVARRAFEPFFTTKPRGQGTGLGLATVYGIVQQSHGDVTIDSTVGEGTTITVVLQGAGGVEPADHASATTAVGGSERILLVEDEAALRVGTSRVLAQNGYEVVVACDGVEALEMIEQMPVPIDLVVTDVMMPRMCGDELALKLGDQFPDLPVIFVSGYDSGNVPLSGRVLDKPVMEVELLRAVREVLDG